MGVMGVKYVTIDVSWNCGSLEGVGDYRAGIYGDNPNLFDASVLARFLSWIKRPEWTADRITALSPPMLPMVKAVGGNPVCLFWQ